MPSRPLRALVVDDEKFVRILTANALSVQNIVCDLAESGTAAAKMLEREHYDFVITDIKMPNGHGHALCQNILNLPNRPILVVITGLGEPRLIRDLELRGVDATFLKPLDFSTFSKHVRSLFDDRHSSPATSDQERPIGEPHPATDTGPPSPPLPTVAILMGELRRAHQLAAGLAADPLKVFVPETTDALCRFVEDQEIDIILIEDVRYGFLRGAEILGRIQSAGARAEAIVIGDSSAFTLEQIHALRIRKLFSSEVTESDLIQSVRSTIVDFERAAARISPEARALVRSYGAPAHSPFVLLKLANYLQMPPVEIPIADLSRDIMSSPATTAELLRLSNGASVGMRRPVTEVWEALSFLGPARAVALLLASGIRNVERSLLRKFPADLLAWYQLRTFLTAAVSSVFAERHFNLSGETAFVLGLFQDMGILVLANAFGDRYCNLIEHARTVGPVRLHAIEQQYLHVNHAQVSAALIDLWQLPEQLVGPVRCHHDSGTLGEHDGSMAFVQPMRIGEAFADLWENRHPTRKDTMSRLLMDCPQGHQEYNESLAESIRKTAEYAKLFLLPVPDSKAAVDVCKDILTAYSECRGRESTEPVVQ